MKHLIPSIQSWLEKEEDSFTTDRLGIKEYSSAIATTERGILEKLEGIETEPFESKELLFDSM
jgi:hypothetical protein